MKRYRKKPVVIEAMQWTGDNFVEIDNFITVEHRTYPKAGLVEIPTLEGVMEAEVGDFIIKGIKGEFYPCKPDIFEETYDLVEDKPSLINNITFNIEANATYSEHEIRIAANKIQKAIADSISNSSI